jgi:polysaccharide export outer membrane protein
MAAMIRTALIALVLAACGSTLPKYDYAKEPDPRNQEIILGVGDVVGINVWDQKDLNTEAVIRPDGTITMPLVGDIKASGLTPSVLKERIKQQLANFLKMGAANEVTVAVRAWKSYRFTIEGEVTRSGVFTNDQYVTVAEALAMAGGLSRFARHDEIKLMRRDKTGYREIPLDYDALASGKRPDMNIFVLPGDQIYVP